MSNRVTVSRLADLGLMDRSYGRVLLTRNKKIFDFEVQSLHDSEMHAILLACKPPEPPKRKEAKLDERNRPVMDTKTKCQIMETIVDLADSDFQEKLRDCDRKKNMMIVVSGLKIDWEDKSKIEDKIDYLSKHFSPSEIIEMLAKILELGVVDQDVLDAEKNELSHSAKEENGSVDSNS
jgi:hypothetical protein